MKTVSILSFFVCMLGIVAFFLPSVASAQSVGIGFGLGLPLMDYFTNDVDREYRVSPEPGYYPVLKTRENANGSLHVNANVLIPFDDLGIIDDVEIRFDVARFRWKQTHVTHVSCSPVDVVNGEFNDASASYVSLDSADCVDKTTYKTTESIADNELASLWFLHISGGARSNFLGAEDWNIFAGIHLGFTISMYNSDVWFGGNVDAMLGIAYRLSPLVWLEFAARLMFLVTSVPDDTQSRINHEVQTGGNIFTSLFQPDAYVDFQLVIRFDFNEM